MCFVNHSLRSEQEKFEDNIRVNSRNSEDRKNTMAKRKDKMIYIENKLRLRNMNSPNTNCGVNTRAPEGLVVRAPLVASVVLLFLITIMGL